MTVVLIAFAVGAALRVIWFLGQIADDPEHESEAPPAVPPSVDLREAYRPTMIASEARRYLGIQ